MNIAGWELLGNVSPRKLTEARVVQHHAAQLVAAVGRSLVPALPDDGHTSLEWQGQPGSLLGLEVPGPRPWRLALRPDDLSISLLAGAAEIARLPLAGRTQAEAFEWLVERAQGLGAPAERLRLAAPYSLPQHAVGAGAPFVAPGDDSLGELTRWFSDANALLRRVAGGWAGSAPVRVWPHHFDIGSVLPLGQAHGEDAPSTGVGLSPGDEGIAEPYFYVTPWPPPPTESLPELPAGGRWHREGWTGAVLTGSEVVAAGDGEAQESTASAFLSSVVELLRARHDARDA